jgi:hypothetical protein
VEDRDHNFAYIAFTGVIPTCCLCFLREKAYAVPSPDAQITHHQNEKQLHVTATSDEE